jgi:hypothetical protein
MERTQYSVEDEALRRYATANDYFRSIEVTEKVMKRISRLDGGQVRKGYKPIKRTALLTALTTLILLVSATAYATTEFLQIRNAAGWTIVKTENWPPTPDTKMWRLISEYDKRVRAALQPGEIVAYYINDEAINAYDKPNKLKYAWESVKYTDYADYMKAMKRDSAPRLTQPGYLPEGFAYSYGEFSPKYSLPGDKGNSEYKQIMELFIKKAMTSHDDDNDKLFIEPLKWTKSMQAALYYSKGKTEISLQATKTIGLGLNQPDGSKAEKVTIKGQETIYVHKGSASTFFTNQIGWFDEKMSIAYYIADTSESNLTREEFLRIAKSMITE